MRNSTAPNGNADSLTRPDTWSKFSSAFPNDLTLLPLDEYANGDYSQIEAFLVGSNVDKPDIEALSQLVLRRHLLGHRPPSNVPWNFVSLVTYQAANNGKLEFERVVNFASLSC